jgi:hypothetical protein
VLAVLGRDVVAPADFEERLDYVRACDGVRSVENDVEVKKP